MPERDASGADFARLRVAMYGIEDPEQNRKGWQPAVNKPELEPK